MKNNKFQFNKLDVFLILLLAGFSGWFIYRSTAGIHYTWHWSDAITLLFHPSENEGLPYFVQGIIATLRLSIWGAILAILLGVLIGAANFSSHYLLKLISNCFIQFIRNIPPLVFVFIFYFFISNQLMPLFRLDQLINTDNTSHIALFLFGSNTLWDNLFSGVLCVGLISAAYIAEIIRSGLENIDKGQWEAAKSLGLSRFNTYRFVIAPQVIKQTAPMLAGQLISLIKDTSIISLISIQEMTFVSSEIASSSGYLFEIWLIVGFFYFLLCFSLSRLFTGFE